MYTETRHFQSKKEAEFEGTDISEIESRSIATNHPSSQKAVVSEIKINREGTVRTFKNGREMTQRLILRGVGVFFVGGGFFFLQILPEHWQLDD